MSAHFPSPPTTQRLGTVMPVLRLPSMSASAGCGVSCAMARFMARNVAPRMLYSSISSTVANAMP